MDKSGWSFKGLGEQIAENFMTIFLSELIGTALLILLGNGVVANTTLEKSGMKGGGSVQITIAWGLAVLLPVVIFADSSGALFNPALVIALAVDGSLAWNLVPIYIIAEFIGGFVGAVFVFILFKAQFDATEDTDTKLGAFATRPAVPSVPLNFLSEMVGTFVLMFVIKGIGGVIGISGGMDKIFVFAVIVSIGMSLGGLTGYAINPARDFSPRLAHWLLPISHKGTSNWGYAWIPIFAPILGALLAVMLYSALEL